MDRRLKIAGIVAAGLLGWFAVTAASLSATAWFASQYICAVDPKAKKKPPRTECLLFVKRY
jgi:hypothetical protein